MSDVPPVAEPGGPKWPWSPIQFGPLLEKINFESPQVTAVLRFRSNAARDEDVETFTESLCSFPLWTLSIWT